jgi:hypothetical protein
MAKLFYQSLQIPADLLRQYETTAKTQEDVILHIFTQLPDATKSELYEIFGNNGTLISESSISRSLSNLNERGQIMMTDMKRIGIWNKPNTVYTLVTEANKDEAVARRKTNIKVELTQDELDATHFAIGEFIKFHSDSDEYENILFEQLDVIYNKLIKKIK